MWYEALCVCDTRSGAQAHLDLGKPARAAGMTDEEALRWALRCTLAALPLMVSMLREVDEAGMRGRS